MKNIVIGRYIPGNSFIYRMDPRNKIITMLILMIATFIINDFRVMLIALLLTLLLLPIGKISIKRVYLGLRPLMFLLLFTFSFQILFNTQGPIVFDRELNYSILNLLLIATIVFAWFFTKRYVPFKLIYFLFTVFIMLYVLINFELGNVFNTGNIRIYQQGLELAFFIMIRLIIIVTLSTILTISTKPTDLNLGLEHVLKPLKIFRINTEEIAMIIAISLRYIPTLLDEANKIMLAQASRGVDFTEGKLKDKVVQIVSLLVPMFIISFKRSDELANAMEARSFVPGRARTKLQELIWTRMDTIALCFGVILLMSSLIMRVI